MPKKEKEQKQKPSSKVESAIAENWRSFGVFVAGAQQFIASPGEVLEIPFQKGAEAGQEVIFNQILLIAKDNAKPIIGKPFIEKAELIADVLLHGKTPKKHGFTFKAKSRFRKRYGYRQKFTTIFVKSIRATGIKLESTVTSPLLVKVTKPSVTSKTKAVKVTPKKAATPKKAIPRKKAVKPAAKKKVTIKTKVSTKRPAKTKK